VRPPGRWGAGGGRRYSHLLSAFGKSGPPGEKARLFPIFPGCGVFNATLTDRKNPEHADRSGTATARAGSDDKWCRRGIGSHCPLGLHTTASHELWVLRSVPVG